MRKVIALFLALVMLTINVGMTYAAHYCEGKIVNSTISLTSIDIDCGMVQMDRTCDNDHQSPVFMKERCCEDKYVQVKVEDEYSTPLVLNPNTNLQFIIAFVVSYANLYSGEPIVETEYIGYSPPLLNRDIPVMVQSFLI